MSGLEEMSREELIALTRALLVENATLRERVAVLEKENAGLRERVARLERLISRNSGNSGMPPSADDLPGRTAPGKRAAKRGQVGKRRPGKQPGAEGRALAWSDQVSAGDITEHFPQGACACGADLGEAADLGVTARHRQIEIPLVSARRFNTTCTPWPAGADECTARRVRRGCPPRRSASGSTCRLGVST
ncbi:DUF6444 domain-containing protein [Spongiactinospora sp. 9N601]|uniref:DUF6444 domain-containing protein n=1 Tax=Spongiactinospora sp. 9N601 TaxID=3375149 RepID=UPI0037AD2003